MPVDYTAAITRLKNQAIARCAERAQKEKITTEAGTFNRLKSKYL